MDDANGQNNTDALPKSCCVRFLLKCPKWRPRLLITHGLSEETNNDKQQAASGERFYTNRQVEAESEALQGGGLGGSRDINI